MTEAREVNESPLRQGADEQITYQLTVTPWGSNPANVQVKAYDVTEGAYSDVSASVLSGSAAVSGDVITLPRLSGLAPGSTYKVEVLFACGVNVFECWLTVLATR